MAGATNEDLAALLVTVTADLTRYRKDMGQVVDITAKAAKAAEKSFTASNDNTSKSFDKAAASAKKSIGAVRAETANMAAQFQDIATQLQGGGNPLTVAFQQGQQLGTVLKEIQTSGGSVFQGLAAAAGSFLNPITLITVAAIAAGGALIKLFSSSTKSAEETIKALDTTIDQLKTLEQIATATGNQGLTVKVGLELDAAETAKVKAQLQEQIDQLVQGLGVKQGPGLLSNLATNIGSFFQGSTVAQLNDAIIGIETLSQQMPEARDQIDQLRASFDGLNKALAAGNATDAQNFLDVLSHLDLSKIAPQPAQDFRDAIAAATPELQKVIDKLQLIKPSMDKAAQATERAQKNAKDYADAMEALGKIELTKQEREIKALTEQWEKARAAAASYGERVEADSAFARGIAKAQTDAIDDANESTIDFLKRWEQFRAKAYMDVNHFRVGFGSDTFTDKAGRQGQETQAGTFVTEEQALDDLKRRVREIADYFKQQLGTDVWERFSEGQKKALIDTAYNFGQASKAVEKLIGLVKSGAGTTEIATAISQLGGDRKRRAEAAEAFGGDRFSDAQSMSETLDKQRESIALTADEIKIKQDHTLSTAEQTAAIAALRVETQLLNEAKAKGLENDPATLESIRQITEATKAQTLAQEQQKQTQRDTATATKQSAKAWQEIASLGQTFVSTFVNDLKQGKSAAEALRDALSRLADQLLQMAIQGLFDYLKLALGGTPGVSTGTAYLYQSGGVVGQGGPMRGGVSPWAFAGAPRMAGGGFVGVRPGEYPAILHAGEVVIPSAMVRSAMSGSSSAGGWGVRNHNVVTINVNNSGDAVTGDVRSDTARGKALGRNLMALVQGEMAKQSRPGGMLTAAGSAGRVGR